MSHLERVPDVEVAFSSTSDESLCPVRMIFFFSLASQRVSVQMGDRFDGEGSLVFRASSSNLLLHTCVLAFNLKTWTEEFFFPNEGKRT